MKIQHCLRTSLCAVCVALCATACSADTRAAARPSTAAAHSSTVFGEGDPGFAEAIQRNKTLIDRRVLQALTPTVILAHIKGEEGISFPAATPRPPFRASEQARAEAREKWLSTREQVKRMSRLIPEIQDCTESKTESRRRLRADWSTKAEVRYDRLYVRDDPRKASDDRRYGNSVIVRRFNSERPDAAARLATIYKVPCLPYRVRSTDSYIFKHYGSDALKNFDHDINGSGTEVK